MKVSLLALGRKSKILFRSPAGNAAFRRLGVGERAHITCVMAPAAAEEKEGKGEVNGYDRDRKGTNERVAKDSSKV